MTRLLVYCLALVLATDAGTALFVLEGARFAWSSLLALALTIWVALTHPEYRWTR